MISLPFFGLAHARMESRGERTSEKRDGVGRRDGAASLRARKNWRRRRMIMDQSSWREIQRGYVGWGKEEGKEGRREEERNEVK